MEGVILRRARRDDVEAMVRLLLEDDIGAERESASELAPYLAAFARLDISPDQELIVAEREGRVVGTLQLGFLAGLTYRGAVRAQVEGVRVAGDLRGHGIGGQMLRWAIERSRARGCHLIQLTSNRQRTRAHAFYAALGFIATNLGMKLVLD